MTSYASATLRCVIGAVLIVGCNKSDSEPKTEMSLHQTLVKYHDAPIGESIKPVTEALATSSLLVAIEEAPEPDTHTLKFKVSTDKAGQLWVYLYSDEQEFSAAFPEGGHFVEMAFPDAFNVINSDQRFGGIFINRSPELMYLIPRAMFSDVAEALSL
jgi:hypothetical protein